MSIREEIMNLEERVQELEYSLEDALTADDKEAIQSELDDARDELQTLNEQLAYEGMTAMQYNGLSQSDFI